MKIEPLQHGLRACAAVALGLLLCTHARAQVTIDRAWARATVPNQTATGAFMRMTVHKDVLLTSARSPLAGMVELHEMKMDNGIMRMRPAGELPLKAGQTVELKSGGYHLMIMDLKQQLKAGEVVPVTLEFRAADGSISKIEVKAIAGFNPPAQ
jgi:hypothetical protein